MKKLHLALILAAIYVLSLGIRVFWLSQKEGLHVDEGLTIAIACYNDFMVTANYEAGKKYTGKELKEASLVSDASLKKALTDVRSLWQDNRDPPHTNLYYTLLRLSLIGLKTGDIAPIVVRGGILNLLFFTVSFIYFFLLMRLLFTRSILLQCAATFCAFMSTAAISNTLFIRPYQIQETLFIIFCYYFVLSIGWRKFIIHENNLYISVLPILFMSLLTAFTLLTGYYALLFIGLFGLYGIYLLCANKTYTDIPFYFIVLCFGILFAQILYPKYVSGFFSYRGQEVIKTISDNIFENIRASLISTVTLLHRHFFSYPVIAVLVLCLAYLAAMFIRKQKLSGLVQQLHDKKTSARPTIQMVAWYIFIASVLFLFVVLMLAPYKILRYGMPVFPFLVILPAMLINSIWTQSQKIAVCAMLLLCGCCAFNATFNTAKEGKIENIFRGKPREYVFTQDNNTPVYVFNARWSLWKYANLIPYLNDEQEYYFLDWFDHLHTFLETNESVHLPEMENYSAVYLLTEYIPELPHLNDLIDVYGKRLLENLQEQRKVSIESEFAVNTGEPETEHPYFFGKKITMSDR